MSFDLRLTREDLAYGYVFRIVADDDSSLDMVTNVNSKKVNFILIRGHEIAANLDFREAADLREDKWLHIRITADKQGIDCTIDSTTQHIAQPFPGLGNIRIDFGRNKHKQYYTTDVPPMTLRNVAVESAGDTVMFWKLSMHNRNEVFDAVRRHRALVENGTWEIDKHTRWQKVAAWKFRDKNPQLAYDAHSQRLFIATSDSVCIYDFDDRSFERMPAGGGAPFRSGGSQLIYDPQRDKLLSYSICFEDFAEYDFATHRWSAERSEGLPPIQHHSRFVDTLNRRLVVFGGYGDHTYHAELAVHGLDGDTWKKDTLSPLIPPRYLCAMGYKGDGKLLVMGGYGSESGKQEESPYNLYDLYEIDIDTLCCRKIADFTPEKESLAMGNSLVVDPDSDRIYALTFSNNRFTSELNLLSFDLRTHSQTNFGDSIPYRFLDTESFADLIYNKKQSKLYAVVLQARQADTYDLELYSLSFPPLHVAAVHQQFTEAYQKVLLAIILAIIGCCGCVGWYVRSKISAKSRSGESSGPISNTPTPSRPEHKEEVKQPSTICLLGGLQIFSKEGVDITASLTPVVRQILLLILLNSAEEGKGITSQKIDETFWAGMTRGQASNNRNVNMRKLRLQLQKIGDITLLYNNEYWYLQVGTAVRCDYLELQPLLRRLREQNSPERPVVERVLALASHGLLLPNNNLEWMDQYKADYSNTLIDALLNVAKNPVYEKDNAIMLLIAKTILLHDCIDEDAIRIQCRILYRKGQKGLSKQAFDKFCGDYMRLLGVMPDLAYDNIIADQEP